MKMIIAGGGVGGLAIGRQLASAGHEVEVYEQADGLRTEGAALIVWPNGTGVLRDLGVIAEDMGSRMVAMDTYLQDGSQVLRLELDKIEKHFGHPTVVVPRARLLQELALGLPAGALRFGKRCVGVTQPEPGTDGPVVVRFADGSTAEGDALIAADGYGSAIRRELVDTAPAATSGLASWHGMIKRSVAGVPEDRMLAFYGDGGFCAMFSAGEGQLHYAFCTPWQKGDVVPRTASGPSVRSVDGEPLSSLAGLRAMFGHWTGPVPHLLDALADEDIKPYAHMFHKVPQTWTQGRVTMIGDAVHAVSPTLGQGVNQTLEDVWVLAGALGEHADPAVAFRAYEDARRKRVTGSTKMALKVEHRPAPPKILRFAPGLIPFTRMNRWWIKMFSSYLNSPENRRTS
ncbi:NAD(P)/FAD-dependent oxidoreductase [Streptomyces sp. NBC_00893]|uniref:FAD-dependent oxidoreductase n=1 Tax=Streptomyces sp. NBC_00893 TaxID=2975862 RepID=UPI002254CEDD|nr:NAD(P)/FAD-dependent oxidoreductase [Streptomyces sp. NBC_00893]MCX4851545.1 FAD-dependent monooxygenase [Streptomyces sp. NBC_00893]